MIKALYVNGNEIYDLFKANLLDYSVGPPVISNPYQESTVSVIPIKLNESIGVRPVTLKLEFEGDSLGEVFLNISNATAFFLGENEVQLPDGFFYHCVFDSIGTPVNKGSNFVTCDFKLVGYRHLEMQSQTFTESGVMNVLGNHKAPAIIKIEDAVGDVTVNGITVTGISGIVVINGYEKTVMEYNEDGEASAIAGLAVCGAAIVGSKKTGSGEYVWKNIFIRCDLTKFPSLNPGINAINITGDATITVSYTPIFL